MTDRYHIAPNGAGLKPRQSDLNSLYEWEISPTWAQSISKSRYFSWASLSPGKLSTLSSAICLNVNVSCRISTNGSAGEADYLFIQSGTICLILKRHWIFIKNVSFCISQLLCLSLLFSAVIGISCWLHKLIISLNPHSNTEFPLNCHHGPVLLLLHSDWWVSYP